MKGEPTELVAERTDQSTVFDNHDGTKTLRVFDGVAFVRNRTGQLVPVDTTLGRDSQQRLAPAAAADVSMAPTSSDPRVGAIDFGEDASVGFAITSASQRDGLVAGSTVTYPEIRPNADLKLSATDWGLKEEIVLRSDEAPTVWIFPLTTNLTPSLSHEDGTVIFTDARGQVRGFVPPGFMVDSKIDPHRGTGERSNAVTYGLEKWGAGWALRMDLDAEWLQDAARVYPVTVDPSFRDNAESDDTYVSSRDHRNRNNSSEGDLLVGTYNGGAEKAASYLHLGQLKSSLANRYILGASLNLWNYWSYSCHARPVTVYKVTQSWSGSSAKTWAGPSYDSAKPLASKSFAHGYYDCPSGGWESLPLPADRVMSWVHGTESFHGLTVRASTSDSRGWKRFASANFSVSNNRHSWT